ncbi:MAG: two-component sensor histidine kinase [Burkholderiaceae bacterium]|nr:two-component sensor histidine kinase [Burkholderiaceae bacterium]
MLQTVRRHALWVLAWCVVTALGCVGLARMELAQLRDDFETDARIAHRLLSQRVVQHDAVLATLALLQPRADGDASGSPEQKLSSVYPQILQVAHAGAGAPWADQGMQAAEAQSRTSRQAALAGLDLKAGRYWLVLAADPLSYALLIDVRSTVAVDEWPMQVATSPVRVTLEQAGQQFVVQPGRLGDSGWRFDFHKHLAAASQPFDVVAQRRVGWVELPWWRMLAFGLAVGAGLAMLLALQRQRAARRRAEELLRLGQVARLNTLGELAAGMAHELNQPLTAMLANTQASVRMLSDDPPDLFAARGAMVQAVEQARRSSDVVGRLRRAVERPDLAAQTQVVELAGVVRNALDLLGPECSPRGLAPAVHAPGPLAVMAEPVALEQIIHNLLMNALQALDKVPVAERSLEVTLAREGGMGLLSVKDSGPGIPAEVLLRMFEPFFTTRSGGLGLGLSLCETLATGMGGGLSASQNAPRGAVLQLSLPLAPTAGPLA